MKALSYWALLHPKSSWTIIGIARILLSGLATYMGIVLFYKGIILSDQLFVISLIVFISAWILYPVRRSKYKVWKWNYTRQKVLDFCLIVSGVIMLITINNQQAGKIKSIVEIQEGHAVEVALKDKSPEYVEPTFWDKIKMAHLKQAIQGKYNNLVKWIEADEFSKPSTGTKILLISLLMLSLILVVLSLSCVIMCSGSDGLGIIVAVFGLVGIILLWVSWTKRVRNGAGK